MTSFDLQLLFDALAQQCSVRASEHIEDAVDIDVNGTRVSAQWSEDAGLIELTVALPPMLDVGAQPELSLPLFRALLERQWLQWGGEHGLGFGLLPATDEVVAMTSLDGDALVGPDGLLAALQQMVMAALAEWYGICAQVLLQHQQAHEAAAGPAVRPPGSAFVSA